MELEFWGVRGTFPVSGKKKNKYGGYTPCASLVSSEDSLIIIDAGTGITKLGDKLAKKIQGQLQIFLFLTHFHLDHIIGLPFFLPLYSSKITITVYAPAHPEDTARHLNTLTSWRFFPAELSKTKSTKIYKEVMDKIIHIGKVQISHCPLLHPQGSVAYKIQENEKNIIFATDTEHPKKGIDKRLASFAQGASYLIYDAFYTPKEYKSGKQGWGHSTWQEGTKIARAAGVQNLYLSHFNPKHQDSQIDKMISLSKKEFSKTYGAKEGLKITL